MSKRLYVQLDGQLVMGFPLQIPDGLFDEIQMSIACDATANKIVINFTWANAVHDRIRYWYTLDPDGNAGLEPQPGTVFKYRRSDDAIPVGTEIGADPLDRSVVFLLESPHYDEVSFTRQGKYPAAGRTGVNLDRDRNRLAQTVSSLWRPPVPGERIPVVLMNPVPFPASCRIKGIDDELKSTVFELLMADPSIIAAFRTNLAKYEPVLVIDGCTGKLRKFVRRHIKHVLHTVNGKATRVYHIKWDASSSSFNYTAPMRTPPAGTVPIAGIKHPSRWVRGKSTE